MHYPVLIEPDGEGWMASFPDIPEELTGGDTCEEAMAMAADALATVLEFYIEDQRPVPLPSGIPEAKAVQVPRDIWAQLRDFRTD